MRKRIPTGTPRSLVAREPRTTPLVNPGEVVCLVRHVILDGESYWTLDPDPRNPNTHETRWDGFLGSNDGVSLLAEGAYRVVATKSHDTARYPNTNTYTWSAVLLIKSDNP